MPLDEKLLARLANNDLTLLSLDLHDKQLEAKDIEALASALERNQTLTSLDLSWNLLRANGVKALAPTLERNQTLTSLNLSWNILGTNGVKALGPALERNQTLRSLALKVNGLGAEGAKALAPLLERNQTLTELDFGGNDLGSEGAKVLASALECNQTLTSLDLRDNNLRAEEAKALVLALECNQKLFEALLFAVKEGQEKALVSLLERGVSIHRYSEAGYTPLMEAVLASKLSSVKILLSYCHDLAARCKAEEKAHQGKTALELACMLAEGKAEAPKGLLEHKGERESKKAEIKVPSGAWPAIIALMTLYQKHLLRWKTPEEKIAFDKKIMVGHLDLSNQQLDDKAHLETIVQVFQNNDIMTTLDLSGCRLVDAECKILALLLSKKSYLTELNLSYNRITYLGAKYLADALAENRTLKRLNLQGNSIHVDEFLFNAWHAKLKGASGLEVVDVSQNFLRKKCNAFFQPVEDHKGDHKGEHKGEPKKTRVFHFGQFFRSRAVPVTSLIKVEYQITPTSWLVCLTCPKDKEHAMLYVEGMRASGQRFLRRYHITARGMLGIANVEIESITPKSFKPENYHFMEHEIDSTQGETLAEYIRADKAKRIDFSKFYPSSSSDKVNCLEWAVRKLALIDISVDKGLFGVPSRVARGSSCLVM